MTRLVLLAFLGAAAAITLPVKSLKKGCEPEENFIMTYHAAGKSWIDSDGMHIAHSTDGKHWEVLEGTEKREPKLQNKQTGFGRSLMLKPNVGQDRLLMSRQSNGEKVLRDPFVIQDPKTHKFHALWTTGWASQTIGHSSSDDLVNWDGQNDLNVMQGRPDTINTWAPEAIYDNHREEFVVFWSSAQGPTWTGPQDFHKSPFKLFYTTTKDFKDFTAAKPLFEPGHSTIDATMDKVGGKYFLTYKNEDTKTLHMAKSDSPTGGFAKLNNVFSGAATEGPSMVEGKDGEWLLFHDTYEQGGYGVLSSKGVLGPWTDISKSVNVPHGARHATVLKVSPKQVRAMADALEKKNAGKWASAEKMRKLKQADCML